MRNDESASIYVLNRSKIRWSNRRGNPGLTYLDQISKYVRTDKTIRFSAEEIANYAKDKQLWNPSIAVHKLPADDDDDDLDNTFCFMSIFIP